MAQAVPRPQNVAGIAMPTIDVRARLPSCLRGRASLQPSPECGQRARGQPPGQRRLPHLVLQQMLSMTVVVTRLVRICLLLLVS